MPPVTGTIAAPAINIIATDLEISSSFISALCLSIFLIGVAIGPLFLAPLSEIYGRLIVLHITNVFFLIFNTACGFATSQAQLLAFRLLSGIGACAGLSVGGGVISDLWPVERRARAVAIYTLGPLIGPAIGPIIGGFVAGGASWRWAFWAVSIAAATVQVSAIFFLGETYGPAVLARRARNISKKNPDKRVRSEMFDPQKKAWKVLYRSLARPFTLLATQPALQVLAIHMALLYGIMWLVLFSFPLLWTEKYGESVSTTGLNYISIGLGLVVGSQGTLFFLFNPSFIFFVIFTLFNR
jgi:multidrug resistance protein